MAKRRKKKDKLLNRIILILCLVILISVGGIIIYYKCSDSKDSSKYLKIELIGDNSVDVEVNSEYEDLGAKASYNDDNLSNEIKKEDNLKLDMVGTYYYKYTISYKGYHKDVKRSINVVDKTAPEIVLNGKNEITMYVGDKYNDDGAKATDNYDGDITDKIETDNKVDSSKIGEYTITYKVVDSSNNEASIIRTIKVLEKKKETPKKEEMTNTNSNNTGVVGTTSKGYKIEQKDGIYYIDGILIANKSYSLPSSYNPGGLLKVFNDNFNAMQSDAKNAGVDIKVISGFRSYDRQKSIYNNYVNNDGRAKADTYSARPGHSEHQTGLAADINSLSQSFENTKEGKWLNDNCSKYGFIIRYVKGKEDQTGYMFEPWHIRYVGKELAEKLYNNGNWLTLEEYFGISSKYN